MNKERSVFAGLFLLGQCKKKRFFRRNVGLNVQHFLKPKKVGKAVSLVAFCKRI
jgi:hypothetical protein